MSIAVEAERWSKGGQDAIREAPWNIDRTGPGTFRYEGQRWRFGDIIVSDATQTPCTMLPQNPSRTDDQHYTTVFFVAEGLFSITETPTPMIFKQGTAGWVPGWSRVACETHLPTRFIAVALHDRVLNRHSTSLPGPIGVIDTRNPLFTPTLAFLHTFASDPDSASLPAAHPTGTLIADLVSALLPRAATTRPSSTHPLSSADLYRKALDIIRREHTDRAFDPQALAEELHVSLRQLQRSFSENSQTIGASITHERLATAITALHSPTPPASLADLASQAGMSLKELRHAARSTYDLTPRQIRDARLLLE